MDSDRRPASTAAADHLDDLDRADNVRVRVMRDEFPRPSDVRHIVQDHLDRLPCRPIATVTGVR